jgi:hypothetical protein
VCKGICQNRPAFELGRMEFVDVEGVLWPSGGGGRRWIATQFLSVPFAGVL